MTQPVGPSLSDLSPTDGTLAAVPTGQARDFVLSKLLSEVYQDAAPPLRARLLELLLKPMRPLGLVAVAAGAFGSFLHRENWSRLSVSIDESVRYSAEQVFELARYVNQFQPEALQQVAGLMADNPVCLNTLSATLLLVALRLWFPATVAGGKLWPAVPTRGLATPQVTAVTTRP
jgi:hypothetical protein